MSEIKLVAIDLDGTLLNDRKQLSPGNRFALLDLLSKGVLVVLASARDCGSIHCKVPIKLPGLYYLGSGGVLIYETATSEVKWSSFLSPTLVREGVNFLKQFDHPVFLNWMDDYWVDRYNERVRMIEERYNLLTQPFVEPSSVPSPTMRVSLAAPISVLEKASAQAKKQLGGRFKIRLASPDWLDFLPTNAGKGQLLAILQEMFGITADQTMAIGDYESDLSLFDHAYYRIAMGNAVPAVKKAASFITGSNNEDGVAQALQIFF